jgi:hypothetical protein
MQQTPSELYLKLLGETARISWAELQPFFARGVLLQVTAGEDLVAVAEALAADDRAEVAARLSSGQLSKLSTDTAQDLLSRDPPLWAVVVAPWVVIQEQPAEVPEQKPVG